MALLCFPLWCVLGLHGPLVAPQPSHGFSCDLQAEVRRLVAFCRDNRHPPERLIREMLVVYRRLSGTSEVSPARRRELQNILARRMLEQAKRMVRRVNRENRSASLLRASYSKRAEDAPVRSAPGGAAVPEHNQARKLIELIQRTVGLDSWAVNGGRGTISYFAPAKALVVRQRGEIHRELQGLLRQLRR